MARMSGVRYLLLGTFPVGCGRIGFDLPVRELDVEKEFPFTGSDWNSYVLPDGSPCPYGVYDEQFLDACIHGGERIVVSVPDLPSCAGVRVGDALGAFDWACVDGDPVTLHSRRLRPETRLAALLEADAWRENYVYIKDSEGHHIYESPSAVWWSNPVVPLPDNSTGSLVVLDQRGTIYTLAQSRATAGYLITAHEVGLVTLDGATLSFGGAALNCNQTVSADPRDNPDYRCVVTGYETAHVWLEAAIDATGADTGVYARFTGRWTVRHLRVRAANRDGVYFRETWGMKVDELSSVDNLRYGFHDLYGYYASERDIVVANNNDNGMRIYDGWPRMMTNLVAVNNGNAGVHLEFDMAGVFTNILSVGNTSDGVRWIKAYLADAAMNRVVTANNGGDGLQIDELYFNSLSHVVSNSNGAGITTTAVGFDNRFAQLVLTDNTTVGLATQLDRTAFSGNLVVGNNGGGDCTVATAPAPGIDASCQSAANLVSSVDATNSFVGVTGQTATEDSLASWFMPPLTVWRCDIDGSCAAWDFSLSANDTALRGAAFAGRAPGEPFVKRQACPAAVDGNRVMRDTSTSPCQYPEWPGSCRRTYLLDAIERADDHIGNDDGLCESYEACIYAPNFGLDQGSGELDEPCVFADGLVSGVTMYAYREP